ncbi:MAG: C-GCAxxG-C-C family protein [Clostridiales bacterium]|nr:C-GCAxxG-C-C family protein [Clostridiales bacterium]
MNRSESALQSFRQGWSCSQAVLSVFCESLGLEREKAFKISQAFGGGMARMGKTCGAVTGAMMVIGLKHGRTRPEDEKAKEKTYALVLEMARRFQERHGSLVCRELIGFDLSTAEDHEQAKKHGVFESLCPQFVADAVTILEGLI